MKLTMTDTDVRTGRPWRPARHLLPTALRLRRRDLTEETYYSIEGRFHLETEFSKGAAGRVHAA